MYYVYSHRLLFNVVVKHVNYYTGNAFLVARSRTSVGLTERSFQDEVVSRQASQSYCGPGGGYEDIAECRKTRTERHPVPAIVSETTVQQKTRTCSVPSKKASLFPALRVRICACVLKTFNLE